MTAKERHAKTLDTCPTCTPGVSGHHPSVIAKGEEALHGAIMRHAEATDDGVISDAQIHGANALPLVALGSDSTERLRPIVLPPQIAVLPECVREQLRLVLASKAAVEAVANDPSPENEAAFTRTSEAHCTFVYANAAALTAALGENGGRDAR